MNPKLKTLLFTVGFYVLFGIVAAVLHEINPGGPCVMGLGTAMMFFLLPISIFGLIATLILFFSWRTQYKWSIWVHFLVLLLFLMLIGFTTFSEPADLLS